MPLPKDWEGVFYGEDTCGDWLFDLSPAEFLKQVEERPDAAFLMAGACFDLLNMCYKERYEALLDLAVQTWPDKQWGTIPFIYFLAIEAIRAEANRKAIRTMVSNVIGIIFGGPVMYVQSSRAICPLEMNRV